jgi:hypothetical protein
MPPLTAANVKVKVTNRALMSGSWQTQGEITFGDAVLTYPTGGIPLPASGAFGCPHGLKSLDVPGRIAASGPTTVNAPSLVRLPTGEYRLQLFQAPGVAGALAEVAAATAPAATTLAFTAIGS